MGQYDSPHHTGTSFAVQSLREYVKELDVAPSVPPTLDYLLEHTHTLSNRMQGLLGCVLRAHSKCGDPAQNELEIALEHATDSITCLKEMMLTIQRLRRTGGLQSE